MTKALSLLLCLFCLSYGTEYAMAKDSTSNPHNNVTASNTGVPVGTIIAWPSNSMPKDSYKWLECNGQTVSTAYPLLQALMTKTPDLNGRFLRGTTSSSQLLTSHDDTIKSHHSKIVNRNVTAKLLDTSVSANLDNRSLTASLTDRSVTATLTNTAVTTTLTKTDLTGKTKAINNVESQTGTFTVDGTAAGQDLSTGSTKSQSVTFSFTSHKHHSLSKNLDIDNDQTGLWAAGTEYGATVSVSPTLPSIGLKGTAKSSKVTGTAKGTVKTNIPITDVTGNLTNGNATGSVTNGKSTGSVTNGASTGSLNNGHSTGSLNNGNVKGTLDSDDVAYDGADETAPKHVYVRYLIRAMI